MIYQKITLNESAELTAMVLDPSVSFRVYRKRPAVIICPGGAYLIHATKEGEMTAHEFLSRGYHCFILNYTVGTDREHPEKGFNENARYPRQAAELLEAIHIVRSHAEAWYIDSEQIFLMGFSAGAHVCATAGTRWKDPELLRQLSFEPDGTELKAAGMVLGYPMLGDNPEDFTGEEFRGIPQEQLAMTNRVLYGKESVREEEKDAVNLIRRITADTVPAFLWHSIDDPVVDARNSTAFIQELCRHGIACEYHLFSRGRHGLGLADSEDGLNEWPELADAWMKHRMEGEHA